MFRSYRILIVLSVLAILISVGAVAAQEPVTLEWWTVASPDFSEQVQRDLAAAFEAEHPGIHVNVTVLPEDGFIDRMTVVLGSGVGAPDLAMYFDNNWFRQALDLRPYIERDNFDTSMYLPAVWDSYATWGDVVVGLPLGVGASFVMFNKDLFDAAGVPYPTEDWTTEEYIDIATQMTNRDQRVFGGDRPGSPFRAIFFNYGAQPYSDDSTTVEGYLNSPESVAAYQWFWDLVQSGATPTPADMEILSGEGGGPGDLFLAGRVAIATLNPGWMLTADEIGINYGVVPEPQVEGNDRHMLGWSLTASIYQGTEHPDEAWEFLKFWAGPEGQEYLMTNGHLFPSIPEVLAQHPNASEDAFQGFMNVLELENSRGWWMSHLCYQSRIQPAISEVWERIALGAIAREEIPAALDAIVPTAQSTLDECVANLGS